MGDVQVFLVRVWQHLSQFRASVRGIGEDEPRLFHEPQQLGEFLREASAAAPSPAVERATDGLADANAEPEDSKPEHQP
jgi:hypothetical protein